jgi:hypothetical protein
MRVDMSTDLGPCVVPEAEDSLMEGALVPAGAARVIARRYMDAAEQADPRWADLEFAVCLGGACVPVADCGEGAPPSEDEGGDAVYTSPDDALEAAMALYRAQRADYGDSAEPVQILVWPRG